MNYRQKVGKFGEDIAVKYLAKKGYRILHRNMKLSYKEIDIIANINELLVFFEVKTRTSNVFGPADLGMNRKKISRLKKAIIYYLNRNVHVKNVRLDLISIDIDKMIKVANIKHFKNIF